MRTEKQEGRSLSNAVTAGNYTSWKEI